MTKLEITIQTYEEGLKQENCFKYNTPAIFIKFDGACIMERGTASGGTSVAFKLVGDDGKEYWAELTGNLVEGLNAALQGANARFKGL